MSVRSGIERVLSGEIPQLRSQRLGLIHHPASVTSALRPSSVELIGQGFDLRALFGPQHGAWGEKQDNMIESGDFRDSATSLPSYSLYGEVRKPTSAMLSGLDTLLFDLQDVGVRVYTFIWTMALAMQACAESGVRFVVLDRPNPIGGRREGPLLRAGYESFVGLYPIPLRHGLTCGELATWLNREQRIGCELEVVPCVGWARGMRWRETGLPWVMPSPNLPTLDSCMTYPGMVLLEGTNLSEGRGTTRPFELFGAPFVDPLALAEALDPLLGPGVALRPCHFEPTFQKHAGATCGGGQLHVTDLEAFRPVHTAVAILCAAKKSTPEEFKWREPPYEYEMEMAPIDILWGHSGLRVGVETGASPEDILQGAADEVEAFEASVAPDLLYA